MQCYSPFHLTSLKSAADVSTAVVLFRPMQIHTRTVFTFRDEIFTRMFLMFQLINRETKRSRNLYWLDYYFGLVKKPYLSPYVETLAVYKGKFGAEDT
jgi:hypothetical protein